jgi:hypothetical protein
MPDEPVQIEFQPVFEPDTFAGASHNLPLPVETGPETSRTLSRGNVFMRSPSSSTRRRPGRFRLGDF